MVTSSSADNLAKYSAWLFLEKMKMDVNSFRCLREQIQFCVTRIEISTLSWQGRSDLKIT